MAAGHERNPTMKRRIAAIGLMGLLMGGLPLQAENAPSIESQIATILAAPPQKRVELMNAFKRQLARMNSR
jgi:hypothetical protein